MLTNTLGSATASGTIERQDGTAQDGVVDDSETTNGLKMKRCYGLKIGLYMPPVTDDKDVSTDGLYCDQKI